MKKLLSVLFSIAFLLVFISFFSQKILATAINSECNPLLDYSNTCSDDHSYTLRCVKRTAAFLSTDNFFTNSFWQIDGNVCQYGCSDSTHVCNAAPAAPSQPTGMSVSPFCQGTSSSLTFTWTAVPNATYYIVRYRLNGNTSTDVVGRVYAGPSIMQASSLPAGASVQWWIQACSSSGCSSSPAGPTTTTVPCAAPAPTDTCTPSGGTCTYNSGGGCGAMNANWSGHSGACTNSNYVCCTIGGTTTTTDDPCTVLHGGSYYYGGACNSTKTILYHCGGSPNHGSGKSVSHETCTCQVTASYDTCVTTAPPPVAPPSNPNPPAGSSTCAVTWGTMPSTLVAGQSYNIPITTGNASDGWQNISVYTDNDTLRGDVALTGTGNPNVFNLNFNARTSGAHTLKFYNHDNAGYAGAGPSGTECTPTQSFTATCTSKTGDWGTCTPNPNSCDLTGSHTRTVTDCNGVETHPTEACSNAPTNCDTGYTCQSGTCVQPPPPPPPPPASHLVGYQDGTFCETNKTETAYGWACKTGNTSPVTVDLHLDSPTGTKIVSIAADKPRADGGFAANSGCGDVNHGWSYTIPPDDQDHEIYAVVESTTLPLSSSTTVRKSGVCSGTTLSFAKVGLDAIGITGDQVNPAWQPVTNAAGVQTGAGSNFAVKHATREFTAYINDKTYIGTFTFDNTKGDANYGLYYGTIDLKDLATGDYTIKISTDGHLIKKLPGTIHIATTTDNKIADRINLVTGNITTANGLKIDDYNILLSCISDPDFKDFDGHAACNQNANYKIRADLEDNGVIDKFDYNLWLREFSVVNGETSTPVTQAPTTTGAQPVTSTNTTLDSPMHIAFDFYPNDLTTLKDPNLWRNELNSAYNAYQDLTGITPYNGQVITYKEAPAASLNGGSAACLSGNPIQCSDSGLPAIIKSVNDYYNVGFGQLHELGHDFGWNTQVYPYLDGNLDAINDENWANFKVTYVADTIYTKYPGISLSEDGKPNPLQNLGKGYFVPFANQWLGGNRDWTKMRADNYTGLLYTLVQKYGWDPFKKTFHDYASFQSQNKAVPSSDLAKLQLFADTLSANAPAGNDIKAQYRSWGIPIN